MSSRLSDREREVAELLLLGMPYRDIGSQLFISAKTVEHHVARIRRRLGAESRSEMLSMLRAMLTRRPEPLTRRHRMFNHQATPRGPLGLSVGATNLAGSRPRRNDGA